jgi:hypothetical protein
MGLAAAALIASRLTMPGAGVVDVSFIDGALR